MIDHVPGLLGLEPVAQDRVDQPRAPDQEVRQEVNPALKRGHRDPAVAIPPAVPAVAVPAVAHEGVVRDCGFAHAPAPAVIRPTLP